MPQVVAAACPACTAMAWASESSRVENNAKQLLWVHANPAITAVFGVARTGILENKGIVELSAGAFFDSTNFIFLVPHDSLIGDLFDCQDLLQLMYGIQSTT